MQIARSLGGYPSSLVVDATGRTGYADITLDICRPGEEPYYGTNTRYICMTDNREKHNMAPERWQLRKRVWAWWKRHKDLPPNELGLLF